MATGDLKNNLKQFQSQIKSIKYPSSLDLEGLKNGSPKAYLPLYHYLFTSYSNKFNKDIVNSNNELYGKSDLRFMEAVYKIMRVMFSHKPAITREQFFSTGFAERKLMMATEIFRLVHSHYKPQRSNSSYKLAGNLERPTVETASVVHQDVPEPERTRKVAVRASPNMSGAVVLPRSFSGSNLIKTSYKAAIPVSAIDPSVSDSSHDRISPTPRSEHSVQDLKKQPDQVANGFPDMTAEMTKKMADQLTHSVIFLNEKIGKMALAIQNQEERIESNILNKPEPVEQASPSTTLMTNLSKQMKDIMFKMETLSSRIVLLENRMMMMEAKVDDTQSLCRTIISSRNRPQSELLSITDAWLKSSLASSQKLDSFNENNCRGRDPMRNSTQSQNTRSSQQVVREFLPTENDKERENASKILLHPEMDKRSRIKIKDDYEDDSIIDIIGVDKEDVAASSANMAFMKSLVDPSGLTSNLTSDDCTLTTTQIEEQSDNSSALQDKAEQQLQSRKDATESLTDTKRKPAENDRLADTFGDFFSPIRSFSNASIQNASCTFQDSSVISIPYAVGDDEENERRFSTPNKASLDTSTLSRVNRITQMLTETEQLFK